MGRDWDLGQILEQVCVISTAAGVFARVETDEHRLSCAARDCASEAYYRIEEDAAGLWVSFVTPDRWLSESIEADLTNTGDKLEDLIEEELVDQGLDRKLTFEHFRSEDKLFTFRSPIPIDGLKGNDQIAAVAGQCLLAYEAAFRELGNVSVSGE